MATTEALCYGLARRYRPFMVNNVTGFIGPETHLDNFRNGNDRRQPAGPLHGQAARVADGHGILKLEGAVPLEGGLPIVVDGKIVGAVGVSGVTSQQDGQIAQAGVEAIK